MHKSKSWQIPPFSDNVIPGRGPTKCRRRPSTKVPLSLKKLVLCSMVLQIMLLGKGRFGYGWMGERPPSVEHCRNRRTNLNGGVDKSQFSPNWKQFNSSNSTPMRTAVLHQSSGERHRASFRALQVQLEHLVEENAGRSFINSDVVNDSVEGPYVVTEVEHGSDEHGQTIEFENGPVGECKARFVSIRCGIW
ncbi:hypothetical protein HD554DRAFT_574644 [Boletus coccyginus]|nr:hypothetical protein HD554DRAFT_574644 [Boletus coccyginus]